MSNEYYAAGGNGVAGTSAAVSNSSAAANSTCSSSRWLTEEVFKLIDMVQRDEAIYNPRHKYYFCRPYVENFWREVDLKLEKNPGASLAKWTNLRISFRREYTNYLEEKVPPCWSYFDRMFFLHPYLRKKHQQPKSLDTQVQDALVQISTLSNRLQRERAVAAAAASLTVNNDRNANLKSDLQQPLDGYLDYFDEPEQNNSELDEIIEEEQQSRFHHIEEAHSLNNDIKSECDDVVDDYETEPRHDLGDDVEDADDTEMRNFVFNSITSTAVAAAAAAAEKRHSYQRMQHLSRLQTRSYHEDLRAKRPLSQESISSSQTANNSVAAAAHTQRMLCSSTPAQCLVRPTFAKPMELVSTTTNHTHQHSSDSDLTTTTGGSVAVASTSQAATSTSQVASLNQQRHHAAHNHHGHHSGNAQLPASSMNVATTTPSTIAAASTNANANTAHLELCDCKTDPDAMFLMSLLPDIQKLNGRDRGKIKIAFQNILQDYLYPD